MEENSAMLKKIGQGAQKFWRLKKQGELEPVDDIQRDNLDEPKALKEDTSFRFSSVIGHIKKNWSQKSLNEKFK
jgi:hypothetical protein